MWALTLLRHFSTTSWMELSFLLAGLFVWGSNVILLARENRSKESEGLSESSKDVVEMSVDTSNAPAIKIVAPRKRWIEIASVWAIAVASFTVGYFFRDHQELQNTFTFHDVKILQKHPDNRWLLSTTYTGPWEVTLCPDYIPTTWEPGFTLKLLVYEDRGCKRLSGSKLGFVIARDERGVPLRNGEN